MSFDLVPLSAHGASSMFEMLDERPSDKTLVERRKAQLGAHGTSSMFEILDKRPSGATNKLFEIVRSIQGVDERLKVQLGRRGNERVEFRVRMKMKNEGEGTTEGAGVQAGKGNLEIAIGVAGDGQTHVILINGNGFVHGIQIVIDDHLFLAADFLFEISRCGGLDDLLRQIRLRRDTLPQIYFRLLQSALESLQGCSLCLQCGSLFLDPADAILDFLLPPLVDGLLRRLRLAEIGVDEAFDFVDRLLGADVDHVRRLHQLPSAVVEQRSH